MLLQYETSGILFLCEDKDIDFQICIRVTLKLNLNLTSKSELKLYFSTVVDWDSMGRVKTQTRGQVF